MHVFFFLDGSVNSGKADKHFMVDDKATFLLKHKVGWLQKNDKWSLASV